MGNVVMNARLILPLIALLLSPAAVLPAAAETADAPAAAKPEKESKNYIDKNTNLNWGNTKALQSTLGQALEHGVKSIEPKSVQAFAAKPANRLLVAQYLLAAADDMTPAALTEAIQKEMVKQEEQTDTNLQRAEAKFESAAKGDKEFTANILKYAKEDYAGWHEESKQPWTMQNFAATKHAKKLLPAVTGNLDWMTDITMTGECFNPGRVMAILAGVAEQHPEIMKPGIPRDIATSVAVEWAKNGYPYYKALTRADYFIRNWKDDRLNTVFDDLSFFMRRVTCGAKITGDHDSAQVASMEWALENIHLPEEMYTNCCWRCGYKGYSLYGENIQGPHYFAPFAGMYPNKGHLRAYQVGAVCGGLSHFGAYAAVANGVPATTMGEPGHCAYLVRVKDKWVPSYSLGWEHGIHWTPWRECYKFTSMHMATELYQDTLTAPENYVSHTYRALAHLFTVRNKDKAAMECLYNAVDAQPLNFPAWREYALYLNDHHADDAAAWLTLNDALCTKLATRYPEVAMHMLTTYVYPALGKCCKDETKLYAAIHLFWDSVRDKGPERWKVEEFCDAQLKLFGETKAGSESTVMTVAAAIMADVFNKADYAPIIMKWMEEKTKGMPKAAAQLSALNSQLLKAGSAGSAGVDVADFNKAILMAAERGRDIETFQRVGHQLAEANGKLVNPIRDVPTLKGDLVSSGGMVYYNAPGRQDDLSMHWGVLEKEGGYIQAEDAEGSWIAVKLPRDCYINGVVLITPTFQSEFCDDMQLQVSDTGDEGTWQNVGAPMGKCTRATRQHTVDLSNDNIKARYLRVKIAGKHALHLHVFHVYGRKAA